MEAALVGIPIVAARLEPYQEAIAHGVNGMLAATDEEWIACLEKLIQTPDLRQQIGAAARADVLAHHTTAARAANFAAIVRQIVA
jgi:glycosyltransferase involved in cell wall biosynthesis